MITNKKLLAIILTACFFFNATAVLATTSYNDENIGSKIVSLEEKSVDKEKERLKKKFSSMKDWVQEAKPYKNFLAKNQTFLKFREGLTKFFQGVRSKLDEHLNRNYTEM